MPEVKTSDAVDAATANGLTGAAQCQVAPSKDADLSVGIHIFSDGRFEVASKDSTFRNWA